MIKVYISGPISSPVPNADREELKGRFKELQHWLRKNYGQWETLNPVEVMPQCEGACHGKPGHREVSNEHTWHCWMRWDLIAMLQCDAIVMLPKWELSEGAKLEKELAERVGMRVYYSTMTETGGWLVGTHNTFGEVSGR